MAACGGDDDMTVEDAGRDATGATGGRSGAAGQDAGRTDTGTGGGGSGGTGGGGRDGASDASPDRSIDGQGGAGGSPEAAPDNRPANDASFDADAGSVVDSAADQIEDDGNAVVDAAVDGADATSIDAGPDAADATLDNGNGGDTSDAADASDASAGDTSDAGPTTDVTDAAVVDVFDAPSCEDGIPATYDFYNPLYGCGHKYDANPGDADAWIHYDAGFYVDVPSGLGWAFPAGSRSASNAATACDQFTVAGLGDWRMATIDEARQLAGGCAPTASGGSCPISDPSCLTQNCGWASPACDSCFGGAGPNGGAYCKVDVTVCTFFHTSSGCSDCSDASAADWIYIPVNGNFYPFSSASAIPTACVSVVPNGIPATDGG
jgi:hypothetical protein